MCCLSSALKNYLLHYLVFHYETPCFLPALYFGERRARILLCVLLPQKFPHLPCFLVYLTGNQLPFQTPLQRRNLLRIILRHEFLPRLAPAVYRFAQELLFLVRQTQLHLLQIHERFRIQLVRSAVLRLDFGIVHLVLCAPLPLSILLSAISEFIVFSIDNSAGLAAI